jgi:hypothetical protein
MEMKTKIVLIVFAAALGGGALDSTVGSGRIPCRDEVRPSSGSLFVRYSNPSNFDTVVISLDPRAGGERPFEWSPAKGTRSDVVKGLGFIKYWVMARYVRGGDTVDVFDSETIDDGKSTNSEGCVTYDPQSVVNVEVVNWPK